MADSFAHLFHSLRKGTGKPLRLFCKEHGFHVGTLSRIERNRIAPPASTPTLESWARALGLQKDTDRWIEFLESAAQARLIRSSKSPSTDVLLCKMPLFFRTNDKTPIDDGDLHRLLRRIAKN